MFLRSEFRWSLSKSCRVTLSGLQSIPFAPTAFPCSYHSQPLNDIILTTDSLANHQNAIGGNCIWVDSHFGFTLPFHEGAKKSKYMLLSSRFFYHMKAEIYHVLILGLSYSLQF